MASLNFRRTSAGGTRRLIPAVGTEEVRSVWASAVPDRARDPKAAISATTAVRATTFARWHLPRGAHPRGRCVVAVSDGGVMVDVVLRFALDGGCLLYTSDAADDLLCVDLG